MKKAICHYSFHRRWEAEKWTPDRLAEEVKNLGVEGVDFHVRYLGSPAEAPALIKNAIARHGRELSGVSMSNDFNKADPGEFKQQVDAVKQWLVVAAKVQAPVSRIFGGHIPAEKRADPAARAAGRQQILDGLGEVVREAEKLGVILALENHGGLPCTGEEQVNVIETINSPHLKATIDVGNYMQGGQEGHEGTKIAAGLCAYVHFKDFIKIPDKATPWGWNIQACTVGEGSVDHRACLEVLRNAGYDGFVALEYEGIEDEVTGVPRSIQFMNRVM
jgi:sugar phosphate isomerase/epimerase